MLPGDFYDNIEISSLEPVPASPLRAAQAFGGWQRTHLGCHQDDVDVVAEVCSVVLHDAEQEAVGEPQGGPRLHGRQNAGVQLRLQAPHHAISLYIPYAECIRRGDAGMVSLDLEATYCYLRYFGICSLQGMS